MSTIISPPVRGRGWVFQIFALAIVLGMLLALALKTQRQAASEGVSSRGPAILAELRILKDENGKLQKDLADFKGRYEDLVNKQASGGVGTENLQGMLSETKLFAGTAAAQGPGVIVTLHDSPKRDPAETRTDVVSNYLVHDSDVRNAVNELFAAGAEAISVNGQRLTATSPIRCVGPVILVNSVQVAAPYVIKAIGNPDSLEKALELPQGPLDGLFLLDMVEVKKQPEVLVPAYAGSTRPMWAKPVEAKRRND